MVIVEASKIPSLDQINDTPMADPMEVYKVCAELQELCDKEMGIGISAVQAGVPWKLFLVKGDGTCPLVPKGEYGYFVNCSYEPVTEERVVSLEGCLSLRSPDGRLRSFQVERYNNVRIIGHKLVISDGISFEPVDCPLKYDQEGIVFQHEIDHQQGEAGLISTKGKELFVWKAK